MSAIVKKSFEHYGDYDLFVKCDACGKMELVYHDCTDRCAIHSYVHEHGWKTRKQGDRWVQYCQTCLEELEKAKREKWIAKQLA